MSRIEQRDLVLKPSTNINPDTWDESGYDTFVEELCRGRRYQKNAIFTALRFLLGGNYTDLRALARENFDRNDKLQEYHGSWNNLESRLQLPDMLSCSLDLATGTGKSYVLYALAAIMLSKGAVKRVLVLCPSLTIETGLTSKFRELAGNDSLHELMPSDTAFSPPRIINASQTIEEGCICVENYHAVLKHVGSSVRDSLAGCGSDTLILNDEAHHVASETAGNLGKWKEFLTDPQFGFRYVVGVSGTCYVDNKYFCDVVSRYSLREAIEDNIVKNVEYVAKAHNFHSPREYWQPIYQNHEKNVSKLKSRNILPLSIVVTKEIKECEKIFEELQNFLCSREKISANEAAQKILIITSSPKHHKNLSQLQDVDNPQNKTEWIISVSMLSEGWDVKNVFQIVPHKERAFNSKLLIAQVLGRGLRIPEQWEGEQPMVTVYNHEAWAAKIKSLVDEVLEFDHRISSIIIPQSEWHFDLHNLKYDRSSNEKSYSMKEEYNLFEAGYIALPTNSVILDTPITTTFISAQNNKRVETGTVRRDSHSIRDIAEHMWRRLLSLDEESAEGPAQKKTNYAQKYPLDTLLKIVSRSVEEAMTSGQAVTNDTRVTENARQSMLAALNVIHRGISKRITYNIHPVSMQIFGTRDRQNASCSAAELRRDKSIFHLSDCISRLPHEQRDFFVKLTDPDGDFSSQIIPVDNSFHFKSPVNLIIADHRPERKFIRRLIKPKNAEQISGWIKNNDMGFYSIEYAWGAGNRPGRISHTKRGQFSPDFFIKMRDGRILVVEIKDDSEIDEPSRENIGKFQFASEHFEALNEWLQQENSPARYQFNMLTPRNYDSFFASWQDRHPEKYKSELDSVIEQIRTNSSNSNRN